MLEVRDITKVYNPGTVTEQRLFDHFSLTVEAGPVSYTHLTLPTNSLV